MIAIATTEELKNFSNFELIKELNKASIASAQYHSMSEEGETLAKYIYEISNIMLDRMN